jgi:hypothetical protein
VKRMLAVDDITLRDSSSFSHPLSEVVKLFMKTNASFKKI